MNNVKQSGASAGRDMAGRDIVNNYAASPPQTVVEKLLDKLRNQIADDERSREVIEELARYHRRRSVDGIDGLEAKLNAAGQSYTYLDAIEKKEMFAKLLERYALYSSAQQIFAHFLAKVETEFNGVIYPDIPIRPVSEINALILDRIVHPIVEECGCGVFTINANHVLGMVYWLAEQCFIRWHHPVS